MDPLVVHQTVLALVQPIFGIASAPILQQFVEFLKDQFKLPTYAAPVVAILSGVLLNWGLALYLGLYAADAIVLGVLAGLISCGWQLASKAAAKSSQTS